MEKPEPPGTRMSELVAVMEKLLAPDGCPWDRQQTLKSLKPYLLEETYEVLEALEQGSAQDHCEELGDLLLQVVFHAALRRRQGEFTIDEVISAIIDKLIRRHPHVFADAVADTPEEVHTQWHAIKAREKAGKPRRLLDGVPLALPALTRAQTLAKRASSVGFDAPDPAGYWRKLHEEIGELEKAVQLEDTRAITHEIGDLLFTMVNLARKLGCDAEAALRATNQRFADRFAYIEDRLGERGLSPQEVPVAEMDTLWAEAKES